MYILESHKIVGPSLQLAGAGKGRTEPLLLTCEADDLQAQHTLKMDHTIYFAYDLVTGFH